jgi:hypothetical protein
LITYDGGCAVTLCFQDKAPYIEELEEQMQKLHEERASAILVRRLLIMMMKWWR